MKKVLLVLAMIALFVCIFAISVSAANQHYSTFDVTLTDGTQKTAYTAGLDRWEGRIYLNSKLYAEAPFDTEGTYEEIDWKTVKILDFSNPMLYLYDTNKGEYVAMESGSNGALCIFPNSFSSATLLTSLEKVITGKVLTVRGAAFSGVTSLKTVICSSSLKEIQWNSFSGCTGLTTVIFESNDIFKTMGQQAFKGCTSLSEIALPDSLSSMGNDIFSGCTALKSVHWPASMTSISAYTFNGCTSLIFEIPSNVTSIGANAFYNCDSFVSVAIPDGVTNLGNYVFGGCDNLEELIISDNSQISNKLIGILEYSPKITSVRIPPLVTEIGYDNFRGCTLLNEIIWPNNLLKISGGQNFTNCGFTSFSIPNTVTEIGGGNFAGCAALEEIRLGTGLTKISDGLLTLKALKRVYISASTTEVGGHILGYSNSADSSSNITFIFTGTKAEAEALRALAIKATEGTNHAPNSSKFYDAVLVSADEYDVTQEPVGYHFIYGYNLCDAFYGGEHAEGQVLNSCQFGCGRNCGKVELLENPQHNLNISESLGENGYFGSICIKESCTVCNTVTFSEDIEPMFESLGYSACTYTKGLSITQGFKVNNSAIEVYKAYAPDFTFGVLATVNSEGEAYAPSLESENVVSKEFAQIVNDYIDIKVTGIPADKADAIVVLCAYVKVGGKTLYLDAGVSGETVVGISYNEANN